MGTQGLDCKACAGGQYQSTNNQTSCKSCGSAAVYCPGNSTKPLNVPRGFLSAPLAAPEAERTSYERCPPAGMECRSGVGMVLDGYWLPPGTADSLTSTTVIYKCPVAADCIAGDKAASVVCESGHTGLLCGVCEPGYGKAPTGACVDCPPRGDVGGFP